MLTAVPVLGVEHLFLKVFKFARLQFRHWAGDTGGCQSQHTGLDEAGDVHGDSENTKRTITGWE